MGKSGPTGGERAFRDFIDLFFGPMVEDGRLASHEFAPLSAAYFALGVEHGIDPDGQDARSRRESFRLGMQEKVNGLFGPAAPAVPGLNDPCRVELAARLVDAWNRMSVLPGIQRLTLSDREVLLEWIKNTLTVWNQPSALNDVLNHAATQTTDYLNRHCATHQPTDGDRKRIRTYFEAAAKLLATLYNPDDAIPSSTASTAPAVAVPGAARDVGPAPAASAREDVRTAPADGLPCSAAPPILPSPSSPAGDALHGPAAAGAVGSIAPSAPPTAPAAEAVPPPPPQVLSIDLTEQLRSLGDDVRAHVIKRRQLLADQAATIIDGIDRLFADFSRPTESPLALSRYRSLGSGHIAVVTDDDTLGPVPFWFLGDIHGDLLGLETAIEYIDNKCPESTIVFLGDLFDDEGFGLEVLLRVFQLIVERPGRIGYIVGNHDVSLRCAAGEPTTFSSSVSPCDFADFLNERRMDSVISSVGQRAIKFFAAAPRAIFLPDGLIATHGGVPLVSRLSDLKAPADLERPECLQDFVWTRAHERARKKIPNPTSKTSEFGFEDFTRFCDYASTSLGIRAKRMVRGHDHFEAGHFTYDRWIFNQCVTVNTMSRRLPRDPFGTFHRTPCVARWTPGAPLEIHQLVIPAKIVEGFYGKPTGDGVPRVDA
ncbi:MAG: serine/threonine protein phosphatase [Proteobacteria bacterium]|nr:serine/threonine protein phosphatase [Pseudomonadota bacterium]